VKRLLERARRHPWVALGVTVAALAIGGLAVAASGILPLKASAGHWQVTSWLLHFTMRRSVSTHALMIDAPSLDDPALVAKGAAHYDLGCRPCHGTPRGDRPAVALAMLPEPPLLQSRIASWSAAELFYIVKHGVKFTGMPAWPAARRDDEVWSVVAFLRRLPELTDRDYLALARGQQETTLQFNSDEDVPGIVRDSCARCHGFDGAGRGLGAFPKIGGQRLGYLTRALHAYAEGRRHSGVMESVVAGIPAETLNRAAAFYAARRAGAAATAASGTDQARGRAIASMGIPARDIPACVECHGPSELPKLPAYPSLAGQHAQYLRLQLELFQQRSRGGSDFVHLMHAFVDRLTANDIRDVAAFFATLEPQSWKPVAADEPGADGFAVPRPDIGNHVDARIQGGGGGLSSR
jgi:cytochrome c553